MTVISRKQQSCEYPDSNTSDIEALDINSATTSDAESVVGDVLNLGRPGRLTRSVNLLDECSRKKGYVGRRKRRLIVSNGIILQTLPEGEEVNSTLMDLLTNYKTPFQRLMENETALKFWNKFTELPEDEQSLVINPKESIIPSICHKDVSLNKISSKVKRAMKIKKNIPFEIISDIEINVLKHFESPPFDLYTTSPKNSFERLMLRAIAQYHNLHSKSLNGNWPPSIQVFTDDNEWSPTDVLFCDIVKQLRK